MNPRQIRMALVFDEWARRYTADPSGFAPLGGGEGKECVEFFDLLTAEMEQAGRLPQPIRYHTQIRERDGIYFSDGSEGIVTHVGSVQFTAERVVSRGTKEQALEAFNFDYNGVCYTIPRPESITPERKPKMFEVMVTERVSRKRIVRVLAVDGSAAYKKVIEGQLYAQQQTTSDEHVLTRAMHTDLTEVKMCGCAACDRWDYQIGHHHNCPAVPKKEPALPQITNEDVARNVSVKDLNALADTIEKTGAGGGKHWSPIADAFGKEREEAKCTDQGEVSVKEMTQETRRGLDAFNVDAPE